MATHVIPFCGPVMAPDAPAAAAAVMSSGWLTTGPQCAAFEDEFAAWIGAEHAITVSSCTAAIELALRALRLPRGARVLVPAITFCGVVNAVEHAGLRPVLADVDPVTMMMTPETAAAAARSVGRVHAIVVLHYAGAPAPVDELAAAARLPRTRVVEDAAHALGTWQGGQHVGSRSHAACFSFYATKNLPVGEGGMLTTDSSEVADFVRSARLHGMSRDAWRRYAPGGSWRYDVAVDGLKANLPEVAAAVGRVQLRQLGEWQARRTTIAREYGALLAGLPGVILPEEPADGVHAWHLYVIRVTDRARLSRDELSDRLADAGVGTSVHFIPLHHLSNWRHRGISPAPLPGADELFPTLLSLPLHPGLEDNQIDRVCAAVADVLSATARPEVLT